MPCHERLLRYSLFPPFYFIDEDALLLCINGKISSILCVMQLNSRQCFMLLDFIFIFVVESMAIFTIFYRYKSFMKGTKFSSYKFYHFLLLSDCYELCSSIFHKYFAWIFGVFVNTCIKCNKESILDASLLKSKWIKRSRNYDFWNT